MKRIIRVLTLILLLFAFTINMADAQVKKKSSRKKGAIIGGVAGAATGAAVSKHHVKGAVIGGAVGAGAGYVLGRHRDKKKGRLKK